MTIAAGFMGDRPQMIEKNGSQWRVHVRVQPDKDFWDRVPAGSDYFSIRADGDWLKLCDWMPTRKAALDEAERLYQEIFGGQRKQE